MMRLLFSIDPKDYDQCTKTFVRNSARAIIIEDGKIAMVHSIKYDYYKFPGGGIEKGEDPVEAVIRESREEAGLLVQKESIREYGYVHRIQKSNVDEQNCFVQDNYYYLCGIEGKADQKLDDYEAEEHFTLEYIRPEDAIETNRNIDHGPKDQHMIEREAKVLEILLAEGYFR